VDARWWQDEQLWRDIGPFLFGPDAMATAEEVVDDLLEHVEDLDRGARILDVGCGPGRLLVPLARRGFHVVGVDVCEQYRRQCRQRAAAAQVAADVRAGAVPDLPLSPGERFDLVLDVFAVIGYPEDAVEDILAVKAMYEALAKGGKLLLRTRNPAASYGSFKRRSGTAMCIEERSFDRDSSIMHTKWTIIRGGRTRVHRSALRVYSSPALVDLLGFCGLTGVHSFESPGEEHITVVGTRPAA